MANPIPNPDLTGKLAVITGASRGLGQRAAVRLAAHGATALLVARTEPALAETARTIQNRGGTAIVLPADLSDPSVVDDLRASARQHGRTSILVNAAGVFGPIQMIKDSDPHLWINTQMLNTVAPYLTCRAFLPDMIDQGWGRIVNVSSAASFHTPGPLNSAYATSKVALNQFTRHLAAEISGAGVTANVIHPGEVKTEMWQYIRDTIEPMGPEADEYRQWAASVEQTGGDDPEKAADLILRLMDDHAPAINGQFLWIADGIQTPIASWQNPAHD